jgi:hypothetical protein
VYFSYKTKASWGALDTWLVLCEFLFRYIGTLSGSHFALLLGTRKYVRTTMGFPNRSLRTRTVHKPKLVSDLKLFKLTFVIKYTLSTYCVSVELKIHFPWK